MIHLHFFLCVCCSREFLFSSMYDNPLTPSPSNFENISSQMIILWRNLRCNFFFTPFTWLYLYCRFCSSVFYRLIKMRMEYNSAPSENLLWTAFSSFYFYSWYDSFFVFHSPKINELIMQLPQFQAQFPFLLHYFSCVLYPKYIFDTGSTD